MGHLPVVRGWSAGGVDLQRDLFHTVLSLQVPRSNTQSCADDVPTCGVQSTINTSLAAGAGIQVLTVDGTAGSDTQIYDYAYTDDDRLRS